MKQAFMVWLILIAWAWVIAIVFSVVRKAIKEWEEMKEGLRVVIGALKRDWWLLGLLLTLVAVGVPFLVLMYMGEI